VNALGLVDVALKHVLDIVNAVKVNMVRVQVFPWRHSSAIAMNVVLLWMLLNSPITTN